MKVKKIAKRLRARAAELRALGAAYENTIVGQHNLWMSNVLQEVADQLVPSKKAKRGSAPVAANGKDWEKDKDFTSTKAAD